MPTKIVIPSLGLTMEEATILEWIKLDGERVEKDEPVLLIETDKSTAEVTAPAAGIIGEITAQIGDVIPVSGTVAQVYSSEEIDARNDAAVVETDESRKDAPVQETVSAKKPFDMYELENSDQDDDPYLIPSRNDLETGFPLRIKASPAARKLARELNKKIEDITGTGPHGRIIEADVKLHQTIQHSSPAPLGSAVVPFKKMRRMIAERMTASHLATSPVTLTSTFLMNEAVALREQMNPAVIQRYGYKLTYDAIFVKAAALALDEHPLLQAQWTEQGLLQPDGIHVGFAVALPEGLVVPVIADADKKSLSVIAREVQQLVGAAKEGKLTPNQSRGGTFTISNLGQYPINGFTPVINLPECAILGIGGIIERPVVDKGVIVIGNTSEISLTFDHRIVDGVPAAEFLTRLKVLIEQPYQLFMEV